jgi:RNA polymerase sigma factor (sigma-70 family)
MDSDTMSKTISRLSLRLQSDSRLAELAGAGSDLAFEAIVERYRPPLLGYCTRLLPIDRAEDVVQQTFVNALVALRDDDRPSRLKPWLYRIAHNVAINTVRKNGWDYDPLPSDLDGVPRPPEIVERRLKLEELVRRIADLPERQRSALVLRAFEGRSYDEIASELDATTPVVRQLLHRARARLRDGLGCLVPLPVFRALLGIAPGGAGSERVAEVAAGAGASSGLAKTGISLVAAATIAVGGGVAVRSGTGGEPAGKGRPRASQLESGPATPAARAQFAAAGGGEQRSGDLAPERRRDADRASAIRIQGRHDGAGEGPGGEGDRPTVDLGHEGRGEPPRGEQRQTSEEGAAEQPPAGDPIEETDRAAASEDGFGGGGESGSASGSSGEADSSSGETPEEAPGDPSA